MRLVETLNQSSEMLSNYFVYDAVYIMHTRPYLMSSVYLDNRDPPVNTRTLMTTMLDTVTELPRWDLISLIGLSVISTLFFLLSPFQRSPFPLINGKGTLELSSSNAKKRFLADAGNLIKIGLSKVPFTI